MRFDCNEKYIGYVMHKRTEIKTSLHDLLVAQEQILAVWEGGAAATGFLDQYSDLDLYIIINNQDTGAVFELLQEHFCKLYGIERQFRMPEPTWHGMSQCFYLLSDCEDFFYLDIAVVPVSNPIKFTELDRHGNALIWFDKESVYTSANTSREDQDKLVLKILHGVTALDFLSIIELRKAIARNNWIAAQMNFQLFVNRHIVPLMNIKYRPCKADFGIRYTDRDYPPEAVRVLEDLLRITSVEDISVNSRKAIGIYNELKAELSIKYEGAATTKA